ncbi:DUF3472 domain-containing protein [Parabacteroides sp. PFB2-10]|uniref:DUF3472 domain-containing protein n=1 Tax=Parabacteroides sp. PFB2-10 TaxID=1742405 RepID=UPI002476792F|nr:DUF3472 domain-containing protein [Parabacteroides sp. PFB2-10]
MKIDVVGNTYVTDGHKSAKVSPQGIQEWSGSEAVLSTWFKLSHTGELRLFMELPEDVTPATLQVRLFDKVFTLKVENGESPVLPIGTVEVNEPGYLRVDMQGIRKEGEQYPFVKALLIDGPAAAEPLHFVRDFEPYWGLRGPSVHMGYALPEADVEYFYNEVYVPEGEDKIGSYFMTNGFGEGYCGIQVNRETERRVLFSVWSPFETDNPQDIPEEQRIKLLAKGEGVHIGEFGNEGSGGQSYLIYPWKAGVHYPVITRVRPDGKGNTEYYAWFYAAEESRWRLIAGFSRPQTNTWYKRAHSFLENFLPQQGYLGRKVFFNNQWVRTAKGDWVELIEGRFTNDATARAGVRMDFAGGVEGDAFFLRNGGFFNEYTELGTLFSRTAKGKRPEVDIDALPLQ